MPRYTTLISVAELKALQAAGEPLMVFDCSFDLMKPEAGEQSYLASHIPGAVYANLDTALSARHGAPGPTGTLTAPGMWLAR
jgi:thiosulfate/3-mercaptopyruvate sulfurtransferase